MLKHAAPFSELEREAVYKSILTRRDVRAQFLPRSIAPQALARILLAAHHAPSVGFMQPWDFLLVDDATTKQNIKNIFEAANEEAAAKFSGERASLYPKLKLEGITESPLNICITCSRNRSEGAVLGRTHMPEMDLFSSVCAAQNMWLAARAEGIGMGWVSIFHPQELRDILGIPDDVEIVAYLCLGYVDELHDKPELEHKNWAKRTELNTLLHRNRWQEQSLDTETTEALATETERLHTLHQTG